MSWTLSAPWGLLALASLPLIYLLHRFVVRGERRVVSSLALWSDRERPSSDGRTPRRPPLTWLLLLELLAATLMSLWLAGLDARWEVQRRRVVVIVDVSASMGARGAQGRGVDEVRAWLAARRQAGALPEDALYTLVEAGVTPRVRPDLTGDALSERLEHLRPEAAGWSLDAALSAAATLGAGVDNLWVFSDDAQIQHPRLVGVGSALDNAAIAHAAWRAGEAPFVALRQFGVARSVTLSVYAGGRELSRQEVHLVPGAETPVSLPVDATVSALEVRLSDDALAVDNRAWLVRPTARSVTVQLSDERSALVQAVERVVAAAPRLALVREGRAALTIGAVPERGASLTFEAAARGEPALQTGVAADPFAELMQGVTTQGLVWSAPRAMAPADAEVLLSSDQGALLWRRGAALTANVALERSNLLSHPAFPILLFNLAAELERAAGGLPAQNFRVGELLRFARRAQWKGPVTVRWAAGDETRFAPPGEVVLGRLEALGLHHLHVGAEEQAFAVNFSSPSESDLTRRAAPGPAHDLVPARAAALSDDAGLRSLLLVGAGVACAAAALVAGRPTRARAKA